MGSCSKKSRSSSADNTSYNTTYKDQKKISPVNNIIARRQRSDLLEKNYNYYSQKYQTEKGKYAKNKEYMRFIVTHDVKKVKNIEVESMPQKNKYYLEMMDGKSSDKELNRLAYLEIEYVMFINDALLQKHFNEVRGDAIIHPYVYNKIEKTDRHVVMGDEYHTWRSSCEINGNC